MIISILYFHNLSFQGDEDEVESENVLSDLVNYIQPVHFKSFEHSESKNIRLFLLLHARVKVPQLYKSVDKLCSHFWSEYKLEQLVKTLGNISIVKRLS